MEQPGFKGPLPIRTHVSENFRHAVPWLAYSERQSLQTFCVCFGKAKVLFEFSGGVSCPLAGFSCHQLSSPLLRVPLQPTAFKNIFVPQLYGGTKSFPSRVEQFLCVEQKYKSVFLDVPRYFESSFVLELGREEEKVFDQNALDASRCESC